MRGPDERMGAKLITVIPEKFVPEDHPLRPIRDMVDRALLDLSPEFSKMYSRTGRPSIPPEKLSNPSFFKPSTPCAACGCSWRRSTTRSCSAGSSTSAKGKFRKTKRSRFGFVRRNRSPPCPSQSRPNDFH